MAWKTKQFFINNFSYPLKISAVLDFNSMPLCLSVWCSHSNLYGRLSYPGRYGVGPMGSWKRPTFLKHLWTLVSSLKSYSLGVGCHAIWNRDIWSLQSWRYSHLGYPFCRWHRYVSFYFEKEKWKTKETRLCSRFVLY